MDFVGSRIGYWQTRGFGASSADYLKRMLHYVNVNCIAELVIVAIFVEMAETTIKFGVFDFFLYISTCVL